MSDIPVALRDEVIVRAGNRCEYCRLSQAGQEATFHIDHVMPRAAGGSTTSANLALACVSCSLRKWAKQSAPDPDTGESAPLFSPREYVWSDHFRWQGTVLVPLTPTGRATVVALAMNRPLAVAIRLEESSGVVTRQAENDTQHLLRLDRILNKCYIRAGSYPAWSRPDGRACRRRRPAAGHPPRLP